MSTTVTILLYRYTSYYYIGTYMFVMPLWKIIVTYIMTTMRSNYYFIIYLNIENNYHFIFVCIRFILCCNFLPEKSVVLYYPQIKLCILFDIYIQYKSIIIFIYIILYSFFCNLFIFLLQIWFVFVFVHIM